MTTRKYQLFIITCCFILNVELTVGFFHFGFETVNKPEVGEPINLQIVFDQPFNLFGKQSNVDIARVSRNNNNNGVDQVPYWKSENANDYNNMRDENQYDYQGSENRDSRMLSPDPMQYDEPVLDQYSQRRSTTTTEKPTLNIHLPSRLPFNVFDLFNPDAIKGFFRNITKNGINSNSLFSRSGLPAASETSQTTNSVSSDSVTTSDNVVVPTRKPEEYADESKINKQVETLNEVLTDRIKNRTVGPSSGTDNANAATFQIPFFPDLSSLGQLWGGKNAKSYGVCNACRVAFGLLSLKTRQGANSESLLELATFGCSFFRITSPEMCAGLVASFGPILRYMVTQQPSLTGERFCGIALQSSGCLTQDPQSFWKIDINQYSNSERLSYERVSGSMVMKRKRWIKDKSFNIVPKGIPTVKVLQLTDIHVDHQYQPGANTQCENEMCCHAANGKGTGSNKAGFYGDYARCDLPFHSFINALEHISKTHPDIELIYMTGDLVPHNIWTTSISSNIDILVNSSSYIAKYFPRVKVIPVIGNHETHPVNMFAPFGVPSEYSTEWLYTTAARAWSQWLPKKSIHNFIHAGFYDVEINPYFRVIVINTNLCYSLNFWQSFEYRDPGGQLRWLTRELQRSEDLGQFVHIVGHIPPQDECWDVWSRNFYEIIDRYSSIVKAQFYGHTHYDEFRLHYKKSNRSEATVSSWIGVSLTPYWDVNPGYKLFTVDGARGANSTWNILDHETWIYNLTEANMYPERAPRWYRLYRATEALNLPDVSAESLNSLVHRMSTNVTDFNTFLRFYYKASDVALKEECDVACRKKILCTIISISYTEREKCLELNSETNTSILSPRMFVSPSLLNEELSQPVAKEGAFGRVLSIGRSLLSIFG